jgi:hypothetical protein
MKALRALIMPVLLLASLPVASVALDPVGPTELRRATHRRFLPTVQRRYLPPEPCLPAFDEDRLLLTIDTEGDLEQLRTADLNGDGWTDAIVARLIYQTLETFEVGILLNDQQGGLVDATQEVFEGPVPRVQHPSRILLDDFDGDGRMDVFIPDNGMDTDPFPGYQNTLVLSAPGGKLVDATSGLPQQYEQTHSAAAADIDADGDVDLYVGNLGGEGEEPPEIWLNDGTGRFTVAQGLLPAAQIDLSQNWYTASQFADVNNDGFPDLILGQADPNRYSHVLINDGTGRFAKLTDSLPPTIFFPIHDIMDIKAADINGDGYLDLVLVDTRNTYIGRYIQILINNGDGTFVDETSTRITQTYDDGWLRYLQLLDLNYDGHMDLVVRQMDGPGPMFYLNNGHGVFREWDHGLDLYNFDFLDIDRDGWWDILNSGGAGNGWPEWHSIMRHIGCRGLAP